jgi:hypothetical protein
MIHGRELRRLILDDEDIELADRTRRGALRLPLGEAHRHFVSDIRGFTSFLNAAAYDVIHS